MRIALTRYATTTQQRRNDGHRSARRTILKSPTPRVPSHGCWRRGGAGGGAPGGRVEGVVGTLLIVELGSPGFFGKHDGCAVGRNNSAKNYGTPTNKVSLQTKSGAGNTMVMSELTGRVDMMGLLVFLIS